jgi:hypothetical protein
MAGLSHAEPAGSPINELARTAAEIALRTFSRPLDTSITLPVGVEAYAAYALRAWLSGEHAVSPRTRRFAKWSAMSSFALGSRSHHGLGSPG